MRRFLTALFAVAAGLLPDPCRAGAWTLERGNLQLISGVTVSRASQRYDETSTIAGGLMFNKVLAQNWLEYGLTDAVTVFVAPEYVTATTGMHGMRSPLARDAAVEAGARILLLSRIGMLSVQASGKTAGAFNMSVSAGGASGKQAEVRLLYGRNFKLFGMNGFADLQVAHRWIEHPRPNEMTIDLSAGFWPRAATLVLLQSFNTISGSGGRAPYSYYRAHKVELSVVQPLTARWAIQAGVFVSPAGQNALVEKGFCMAVWVRY